MVITSPDFPLFAPPPSTTTFPHINRKPPQAPRRRCPASSENPKPSLPPTPLLDGHDDRIQRRPLRPRPALLPAAPPALRGVRVLLRLLGLLPRLLLLHLHARHLPGPARPRRRARGRARRQAPQAAVRPQPGRRPVPPRRAAVPVRHRRGPGPGRRLPLPQHHAPLHRREPQQGGHPIRRHGVRRDVPRRAAGGGGGAGVRAARAQHPAAADPRHRRPLQRAAVRRAGPHPRRRVQRPRRVPHRRRRRRQDPRARLLLPQSPGVGGLRDRHQPEAAVGDVQAMRRGRAKRVGSEPSQPRRRRRRRRSSGNYYWY